MAAESLIIGGRIVSVVDQADLELQRSQFHQWQR